jgi:hypothetical protein
MELINIEQLMRDKLDECNAWLGGKDKAVAELEEARVAFEKAQANVADYTEENIAQVVAYRDDLKSRLGIADVVEEPVAEVAEAHDEQVVEQCAVAEVAGDEIVEQPLL